MNRIIRHRILMITMMGATLASLAFIAMPSFAAYESSLQGYWKFDETSGTTAFDSAGTKDGVSNGATINTPGKYGSAYSFNGSSYVSISNPPPITGPFTTTVWFEKTSDAGAWPGILHNNDWAGFGAWFGDRCAPDGVTGQIGGTGLYSQSGYGGDTCVTDYTISKNIWYMLTLRFDGTNKEMYINTTKVAAAIDSVFYPSAATMTLGTWYYNQRSLTGAVDDLAFWNRALHADETDAIYRVGVEEFYDIFNAVGAGNTQLSLGYANEEIGRLVDVYVSQNTSGVTLGSITWKYLSDTDLIWSDPDYLGLTAFEDSGYTYIRLGSGVRGEAGGAGVPEPATVVGLLGAILVAGLRRVWKRAKEVRVIG